MCTAPVSRCDAMRVRIEKTNISGTVGCKTREGSWAPDQSPSTISYPESGGAALALGTCGPMEVPCKPACFSSVSQGCSFHFHKISKVVGAAAGQGRKCISICSLPNLHSLKRCSRFRYLPGMSPGRTHLAFPAKCVNN